MFSYTCGPGIISPVGPIIFPPLILLGIPQPYAVIVISFGSYGGHFFSWRLSWSLSVTGVTGWIFGSSSNSSGLRSLSSRPRTTISSNSSTVHSISMLFSFNFIVFSLLPAFTAFPDKLVLFYRPEPAFLVKYF